MPPSTPSLKDALKAATSRALEGVHTSMPGTVVSYDRTTQTATIRPAIRATYRDGDGKLATEKLPDIPSVPVVFPTSAAASLTFELAAGDPVILLVGESSTDEYRNGGAEDNNPQDVRRFDLSDSVAIPGGRPVGSTDYADGAMVLRSDDIRLGGSAATDFVALASKVLTQLNSLYTQLQNHTHPTGIGPTGAAVGVTVAPVSPAATKVKGE